MGQRWRYLIGIAFILGWLWLVSWHEGYNHEYHDEVNQSAQYNLLVYGWLVVAHFAHEYEALFTVVFSAAVAAFTFTLWQSTQNLWTVTERLANEANHNSIATQRAFISISDITFAPINSLSSYKVYFMWRNNGTTPTKNLTTNINWGFLQGDFPPEFQYLYDRPSQPFFLGPKFTSGGRAVDIPYYVFESVRDRRGHLFLWGRADYSDIFVGTRVHFAEFCFMIEVVGKPGGTDWMSTTLHGEYNRSDHD